MEKEKECKYSEEVIMPASSGSVNGLVGKLLTLADAAIVEPAQNKSFKSLVMNTVWDWFDDLRPYHDWIVEYIPIDGDEGPKIPHMFPGESRINIGGKDIPFSHSVGFRHKYTPENGG